MYEISFAPKADRALEHFDQGITDRILTAVYALRRNPRPSGVRKMKGFTNQWRIRVGQYRVVYEIQNKVLLIHVIDIAHRREAYR